VHLECAEFRFKWSQVVKEQVCLLRIASRLAGTHSSLSVSHPKPAVKVKARHPTGRRAFYLEAHAVLIFL
jgi:hypothetical protein